MNEHERKGGRCQCGEIIGAYCYAERGGTIGVAWLPPEHRGTAAACGSRHGLERHLRLSPECYAALEPDEDEYLRLLDD